MFFRVFYKIVWNSYSVKYLWAAKYGAWVSWWLTLWVFVFYYDYLLSREFSQGDCDLLKLDKFEERTTQKIKFSIEDFFSKCDQIFSFLQIWSHLLEKSLMENFIFCAVTTMTERNKFIGNSAKKNIDFGHRDVWDFFDDSYSYPICICE